MPVRKRPPSAESPCGDWTAAPGHATIILYLSVLPANFCPDNHPKKGNFIPVLGQFYPEFMPFSLEFTPLFFIFVLIKRTRLS